MSTVEARATAEAREPGVRSKSSSPRQIPVVGVVTEDEDAQVWAGLWSVCGVGKLRFRGGDEAADSKGGNGGPSGN